MGAELSGIDGANDDALSVQDMQHQIRHMDTQIRKRVQRGIAYNMKIIIRGAPGTGKTSLFYLIQGKDIPTEHTPTQEIQASTIIYNYSDVEEARVDIWDVVDKGSSSRNRSKKPHQVLDASTIDVYRHTNAVLLLIHPQAPSSLQYAREVALEIPHDIPLLLLLNFSDLPIASDEDSTVVSLSAVQSLQDEIAKHRHHSNVFTLEISCVSCTGIVKLHKFLSVPYLLLKQRVHAAMLEEARLAYESVAEMLLKPSDAHSKQRYYRFDTPCNTQSNHSVESPSYKAVSITTGGSPSGHVAPHAVETTNTEPAPPATTPNITMTTRDSSSSNSAGVTNAIANDTSPNVSNSPSPPKQLRRKKKPSTSSAPINSEDEVSAAITASAASPAIDVSKSSLKIKHDTTPLPRPAVATCTTKEDLNDFAPAASNAALDSFLAYHSDEESAIMQQRNKIRECAKSVSEDVEEEPSRNRSSLRSVRKSRKK